MLRLLVESGGPISASRIAVQLGMHQSSVSRILASLAAEGFVRQINGQHYEPDFGLLTLSTAAAKRFDLASKPYVAMAEAARDCHGYKFSIGVLWRDEIVYFLEFINTQEPVLFSFPAFPLHLSAPALRQLHTLPRAEAEEILERSRFRHGWSQPTSRVPSGTAELMDVTKELIVDDCLILNMWSNPVAVQAALPLDVPVGAPTSLALSGPAGMVSTSQVTEWLHKYGSNVTASLKN